MLLLPTSEFMVEEHELQKEKIQEDYNDKYWDQRYTIVQHRIPSFLQKMADKILSTGVCDLSIEFVLLEFIDACHRCLLIVILGLIYQYLPRIFLTVFYENHL